MASRHYNNRLTPQKQRSERQQKLLEKQWLLHYKDNFAGASNAPNRELRPGALDTIFRPFLVHPPNYNEMDREARSIGIRDLMRTLKSFIRNDLFTSTIAIYGEFPNDLAHIIIGELGLREGPGVWSTTFDLPYGTQYIVLCAIQKKQKYTSFNWIHEYIPDELEKAGDRVAWRWDYSADHRQIFDTEECQDLLGRQNRGFNSVYFEGQTHTGVKVRNCVAHYLAVTTTELRKMLGSASAYNITLGGPVCREFGNVGKSLKVWEEYWLADNQKSWDEFSRIRELLLLKHPQLGYVFTRNLDYWFEKLMEKRCSDREIEELRFRPHIVRLIDGENESYVFPNIKDRTPL